MERSSAAPARAGALYFALVFGAAFALGALCVSVVAPRLGALGAVLIEAPVVLALAWLACGFALRRYRVATALGVRLAMGGVALALLMVTELGLAAAIGPGPGAWLASLGTAPGAVGLAAQVLFALMPVVRRGRPRRRAGQ